MNSLPLVIAIIASVAGLALFVREFMTALSIRRAEKDMARLLPIQLQQTELESIRDELLQVKAKAIEIGFEDMPRIYEIEQKINLVVAQLDADSRHLIQEGLRQSSERGRVAYMLKLINLGIAVPV